MNNKNRQEIQNRFSLRKLTIGLASVSLGMFFMQTSNQVKADTSPAATATNKANPTTDTNKEIDQTPSKDNSTNNGSQNLVTMLAFKQNTTAPSTDTTKPIAPSTTVPRYDDKKKEVVDTPFYNNPRGTNSKLINGQYTIYFTAKDASDKEYASSYAVEQNNPKGVCINSLLDMDDGAYNPNSLEFHFYYQNNTDKNQTINYTLGMPDSVGIERRLVPDLGSRISDVRITSKQGNTYDISSVTEALDDAKSGDGRVKSVPVNLTVKANDAINLVIPFVLNTTVQDDNNEFHVSGNRQPSGYLNVRSSTYAPLYPEDKIYPEVKVGKNTWTRDYPDNLGAFTFDPSMCRDEDFYNYNGNSPYDVNARYEASTLTNSSTVYGSYTATFLPLVNYEKSLTRHGFTVCFNNGKPMPYYSYALGIKARKVVDKKGNPVQDRAPYFQVVPVILLKQDETYTTKTAPTAWDPSTMINKVADPTNYSYWDQKTDRAVRMDKTEAQKTAKDLTAKDFTVTITKDGQFVKPDANGKYDLSKPGIYTVTYSRDFNGTTISNSGQITVTPVKEPDKPSGNNNNSNNSNTAPTDNDSKPTDETGEKANICSCQDTIIKTLMHAAYLYDNQGVRIKKPFIKAYTAVVVAKTPVVINGIKYYKVPCKDEYIKSGNFDGTSRVLRHNAFVYNNKGKAVRIKGIKRLLKKWRLVRTYGAPFNIDGHQMYRIAKNRYVKVKNFK